MESIEGESGVAGAERCGGVGEAGSRIDLNVRALSSGVDPRTELIGWVARPKSRVGWMEPVAISPSMSSHV